MPTIKRYTKLIHRESKQLCSLNKRIIKIEAEIDTEPDVKQKEALKTVLDKLFVKRHALMNGLAKLRDYARDVS